MHDRDGQSFLVLCKLAEGVCDLNPHLRWGELVRGPRVESPALGRHVAMALVAKAAAMPEHIHRSHVAVLGRAAGLFGGGWIVEGAEPRF